VEAGVGSDGVPVDFATLDIDPTRDGVQVRIYIDVENAGLREGDLNAYLKYVSQDVIDAAGPGPLRDLEGRVILEPGWFDFTRKQDADGNYVGDGARFVTEDGRIVGIELIITDNAFGDNDPSVGRIFDPGVPVRLERSFAAELPTGAAEDVVEGSADNLTPVQPMAPVKVVTENTFGDKDPSSARIFDPEVPMRLDRSPLANLPAGAEWPLEPFQRKTALELIPPGPPPAYVTYITEASQLGISEGFATTTTYWVDALDPPWTAEESLENDGDVFGQPDPAPAADIPDLDVGMSTIRVKADAGAKTIIDALATLFDDFVSKADRVYEALTADGAPLPEWISVDPATGAITVDAPEGYAGTVEIRVTVRDASGRLVVISVDVEIDQQQGERSDAVGGGTSFISADRPADDGLAEMLRVVNALSVPRVTGIGAQASGFSAALAAMSAPSGLLQFPPQSTEQR
jgi:hypothetical protein